MCQHVGRQREDVIRQRGNLRSLFAVRCLLAIRRMYRVHQDLREKGIEVKELENGQNRNSRLNGSVCSESARGNSEECDIKLGHFTHWFLKSSRGGSIGCTASARSGRSEVSSTPKLFAKVGIESSEISWYALPPVSQNIATDGPERRTSQQYRVQTLLPNKSCA